MKRTGPSRRTSRRTFTKNQEVSRQLQAAHRHNRDAESAKRMEACRVRALLHLSDGQAALRAEGKFAGEQAIVDDECVRFGCPFCHRSRDGVMKLGAVLAADYDRAWQIVVA